MSGALIFHKDTRPSVVDAIASIASAMACLTKLSFSLGVRAWFSHGNQNHPYG